MLLRSAAAAHVTPQWQHARAPRCLSALAAALQLSLSALSACCSAWAPLPPAVHHTTISSSSNSSTRTPHGVLSDLGRRATGSLAVSGLLGQQWSSSRGFLSSMMQPESRVYKERRLIG
jgi:hypothetical protein